MTASEFANILENIASSSAPIQAEELQALIHQYPYYQALHILLAQQHIKQPQTDTTDLYLKKAATYATDRSTLYQLLLKQRQPSTTTPIQNTIAELPPPAPENPPIPEDEHYTSSLIDWQAELNDVENQINTAIIPPPDTHPTPINEPILNNEPTPSDTPNNNPDNDDDNDEQDNDNDQTYDDDNNDEQDNNDDDDNDEQPHSHAQLTFAEYLLQLKKPHPHKEPTTNTPPPTPTTNPPKSKKKKLVKELAKASITENDNLISETLAKLLAIQGKKDKAIKMYRQLSLKYPEKSTYFAAKIEQLKNH